VRRNIQSTNLTAPTGGRWRREHVNNRERGSGGSFPEKKIFAPQ
jgi:hypothetical protein